MKRIFLFNPENDIALASGLSRITPPRQARMLHDAGAMLPFWLGDKDDYILVPPEGFERSLEWYVAWNYEGPRPVSSISEVGQDSDSLEFAPWGWSLDACSQFGKAGADQRALDRWRGRMEAHRILSHRGTSLRLLGILRGKGVDVPSPFPMEAATVREVEAFVASHGAAYLKSPWSSSGRGVFPVSVSTLPGSLSRIGGIINRQGSVMVEPVLPKLQDFAMLYEYHGGKAVFSGYSMFFNSTATNYGGNMIASDEEIFARLSAMVPGKEIEQVKSRVAESLEELLGEEYYGPLGVDMMIYGGNGARGRIAPCIELNLRFTMGFVARGVYDRLGKSGIMYVSPAGMVSMEGNTVRLAPENTCFDFIFAVQA